MAGKTNTNQRIATGYISGWRLWLSIAAITLSLTLLSQAHHVIGLSQSAKNRQAWTITAHGPLTPQQHQEIELRLRMAIEQLPQSAGLRYSLQPTSRELIGSGPDVTEKYQANTETTTEK